MVAFILMLCFLFKTDEQNFNLDEQQGIEAKERQALVQQHKGSEILQRNKRDAEEQVNNDQKSDDEEIALQGKE